MRMRVSRQAEHAAAVEETQNLKFFVQYPSHRILWHMYEY